MDIQPNRTLLVRLPFVFGPEDLIIVPNSHKPTSLVEENLKKDSATGDADEGRPPKRVSPLSWPEVFPRLRLLPLSRAASAHLDLIRAMAAWLVLWGHIRNLFFVDYDAVQHGSRPVRAIYLFTGFGHESVVVFFVLSGFLIGSTVLKRFASGEWSWHAYAIDRLTRLYVALIPGLLFGLMWDRAGSALFSSSGLYSNPLQGFGAGVAENRITFPIFLGNLAFLQTLISPVFGSNGPLWSLANEFWYYVLFPIGLAAVVASANKFVRWAALLIVIAICVALFVRYPILPGFLIWMAGCVLAVVYSKFVLPSRGWLIIYFLASSTLLFSCLLAARSRSTGLLASDFALGIAFGIFLFAVLQVKFRKSHRYYPKVAQAMAGFSYSLYVLHFPLLLFLRAWLAPTHRWQPTPSHLLYGLMVGIVSLFFAWLVSGFTEKKTGVVRGWVNILGSRLHRLYSPHQPSGLADTPST